MVPNQRFGEENRRTTRAFVVICGNDLPLLKSRAEVLSRAANFTVEVALGVSGLMAVSSMADAKLVVLCHSLTKAQQEDSLGWVQSIAPDARVIVMMKYSDLTIPSFGEPLPAQAGPRALIDLTMRLTA